MNKKKVLVCGATGFIGRNIVESFLERQDFEVFGTYFNSAPLNLKGLTMLRADLTDKNDVAKVMEGKDLVVQAAATTSGVKDSVDRPYYHVTDNAVMNSLIFRAAHEYKVRHLVFFSCTIMYQSSSIPIKEEDFNAGHNIYPNYFGAGWTKVYIEKMCEFYANLGRTRYTVLRHSNIYGPYDKFDLEKSHVFGATMTKVMMSADKGTIIVWGSAEEERDLLYVSDLVSAVGLSIDKQKFAFRLYNIGYGSSVSVKDLVGMLIDCSGKKNKVQHDLSKPSIKTRICLDISRAREELGWLPKVPLRDGINKTMFWYKSNILSGMALGGKI